MAIGLVVVSTPQTQTVTGVVVAVRAESLSNVTGFTLRTADGRLLEFGLGALQNAVEFPPGHLAEHVASASPVVVTYRDASGALEAIRLADGPTPSPT